MKPAFQSKCQLRQGGALLHAQILFVDCLSFPDLLGLNEMTIAAMRGNTDFIRVVIPATFINIILILKGNRYYFGLKL